LNEKFVVKNYWGKADEIQESMNEHYRNGYFPREIKLEPYQDEVHGFIIFELKEDK
jgi:hypothetical protein